MCAVEPWVNQHHQTLELATGWKIGKKDATQLSLILETLPQGNNAQKPILVKIAPDLEWEAIACHLIRFY